VAPFAIPWPDTFDSDHSRGKYYFVIFCYINDDFAAILQRSVYGSGITAAAWPLDRAQAEA
jgi:hypothetical protein